jgi:hypothetical protein
MVCHDSLGFGEDVARESHRQQQVDDGVVEAQHRMLELHDDEILVVPRIADDRGVGDRDTRNVEARLRDHAARRAVSAWSSRACIRVRSCLELDGRRRTG